MLKKKRIITLSIIILIIISLTIYCYLENNIIEVSHINIIDTNIPNSFNNYKIVQISDLHNKEFNKNKLVNLIKKNKPDIILITGDLIDSNTKDLKVTKNFIKQIVKISPVYYINGNHEASNSKYDELIKYLKNYNVVILENEVVEITNKEEKINLVGLSDPAFYRNMINDLNIKESTLLKNHYNSLKFNKDNYTILLSHRPEMFNTYVDIKANLVFTGHAHGGQIRIPIIGGLVSPNQGLFPKYTSGTYKKENTTMIVSRGLGNSIIPFRINNNPELIVTTLNNK